MNFSGGKKRINDNLNHRFKTQISIKKQPSIKINNICVRELNNLVSDEVACDGEIKEIPDEIEEQIDFEIKVKPDVDLEENLNFGSVYETIDSIPMTVNPLIALKKKQSMRDVVDLVLEKYIRKPKTW